MVGRKVLAHNKLFETNYFKYCEFSIKMSVFFRRDNTPIHDYLKVTFLLKRHFKLFRMFPTVINVYTFCR
jgi:hypothetical protein